MQINQITIIGTGLIGGSFALALKSHGFKGKIIGCDRPEVLSVALERKVIDLGLPDALDACRGSEVVLLATPVGTIIDLMERIGPLLPAEVLITDVGSTKAEIVSRAQAIFGKGGGAGGENAVSASQRFLGGHPMAGKEHSGVEHATAELFAGAPWLLTPLAGQETTAGTAGAFVQLLAMIGARVSTLDAQQHDRLCGWASHLPQMVATALAASLLDFKEKVESGSSGLPEFHSLGGRAMREMTRIASSPYSMWRDIALTNTANIEAALLQVELELASIRENLRSPELREIFSRARRLNEPSPRKEKENLRQSGGRPGRT